MNKIKLTDDQVNALYMAGHDGECLGDAYESTLNTAIELGIVRPAAADAASGEKVVYTATESTLFAKVFQGAPAGSSFFVQSGHEVVVRKVRGT